MVTRAQHSASAIGDWRPPLRRTCRNNQPGRGTHRHAIAAEQAHRHVAAHGIATPAMAARRDAPHRRSGAITRPSCHGAGTRARRGRAIADNSGTASARASSGPSGGRSSNSAHRRRTRPRPCRPPRTDLDGPRPMRTPTVEQQRQTGTMIPTPPGHRKNAMRGSVRRPARLVRR